MLSYSCVCHVFVSLSTWESVNKIASSRITGTGWQAGRPHKSCSCLTSGLLTCILTHFHINASAGNLLCHSEGFLPNPDRKMNALSYLPRRWLQTLLGNNAPPTLELLFETPYERRCALKKYTINNCKKNNLQNQKNCLFPWNARTLSWAQTLPSPNTHQPNAAYVPLTLLSSGVAWHSRKRDRFTVRPATHSLTV